MSEHYNSEDRTEEVCPGALEYARFSDFILDWNRDILYCWQTKTDFKGVAGFVGAIEMGYEMPAVDIVKRGIFYYLCGERKGGFFQYGGHHRSIAYYILGRPMNCNLWKDDNDILSEKRKFHVIGDSILSDVGTGYCWYDYLKEVDARNLASELGDSLGWDQKFLDKKNSKHGFFI